MPIRFRCVYCGQLLSIATRKVGTSVDCPKCSHPNIVPEKDQTDKEEKQSRSARKVSKAFESRKFDQWLGRDLPRDEASERQTTSGGGSGEVEAISEVLEARASGSESESAVEEPWKREPEGLPASRHPESSEVVAIGAGAAIPLAILVVVLLLVAFGLGVVVGRYAWPFVDDRSESTVPRPIEPTASREESLLAEASLAHQSALTGQVHFSRNGAEALPDVGATVIALRHDTQPAGDRKIPATGLRPGDPENPATVRLLEDYGGRLAIVGADGGFRIASMQPGGFLLLVLSNHVQDVDGAKPTKLEYERLARYFADASDLLGNRAFQMRDCLVDADNPKQPVQFRFVSK